MLPVDRANLMAPSIASLHGKSNIESHKAKEVKELPQMLLNLSPSRFNATKQEKIRYHK